ncbi:unnamed protein product, partial [Candidula unifasciata]
SVMFTEQLEFRSHPYTASRYSKEKRNMQRPDCEYLAAFHQMVIKIHHHILRGNKHMYSSTAKSKSSPDASFQSLQNKPYNQPRPPSSSGHSLQNMPYSQPRPPSSSGRPSSASIRAASTRRQHPSQASSHLSTEELPDKPVARPPSSFSKYRPLPAIGTPIPVEEMDTLPLEISTVRISHVQPKLQHNPQQHSRRHETLPAKKKSDTAIGTSKDIPAMSEYSVSSTRTSFKSQKTSDINASIEFIERLDLSQLEKPEVTWKRRPSHSESSHRKSKASFHHTQRSSGDLYDGDDDDSDSMQSSASGYDSGIVIHNLGTPLAMKPVVIPSPESPASREVLLAVKLPTDGTRHQKYFRSSDMLQSIVEFAQQKAGRSFHGYVLVVATSPKVVFVDLEDTIENAGLDDKTVFHLEEYEWED